MVYIAMKIERQLKHIGAAWGLSNSNPNYSSRWPRKEEKNGADVKKEKQVHAHHRQNT